MGWDYVIRTADGSIVNHSDQDYDPATVARSLQSTGGGSIVKQQQHGATPFESFKQTPYDATKNLPSASLSNRDVAQEMLSRPSTSQDTQFHAPTQQLTLQNANTGERKSFKAGEYTATQIDALTRNDWVPLNSAGKPMTMLPFQGGQMFVDPDTGQASPLNVLMGDQLTPEQQAAMPAFLQTPEYRQVAQSIAYNRGGSTGNTNLPSNPNGPIAGPAGGGSTVFGGPVSSQPASGTGMPLPNTGGIGDPSGNGNQLPENWQDILKFMTTAGLNRSQGSNGLIDLATKQLGASNDRTSVIDQFTNSLMNNPDSGYAATGKWRNDVINQMLYQQPFTNPDGTTSQTPGVMDTQRHLMDLINKPVEFDKNLSTIIGDTAAGARGFLDRQNDAPGFSPEGRAALNQQLTRDIPGQFNDALSGAYAELQRRGALGGELPASQADLTRVLAPIYAQKSAAYSKANTDALMTEEQLKLQQLLSNRGLASNAINQLQGSGNLILSGNAQTINQQQSNQGMAGNAANSLQSLIATLGNIYNPNASASNVLSGFNSGTSALEGGTGAVNAATNAYSAGNQAFGTSAGLAESGTQTYDSSSLKNLILSALFSGGISAATRPASQGGIDFGKIFSDIFGGGGQTPNTSGTQDFTGSTGGFGPQTNWKFT